MGRNKEHLECYLNDQFKFVKVLLSEAQRSGIALSPELPSANKCTGKHMFLNFQ